MEKLTDISDEFLGKWNVGDKKPKQDSTRLIKSWSLMLQIG